MSKYLVIVESPAKAKTIGKFLGKNYKVKASVGHVRDLPKSKMGIDIEDDFEPQYITIRGKGDVIKELRAAAKKADKVYLATDPDREGEAIAWHLQSLLEKHGKSFSRITFNAITKETVKQSIKEAREIDMHLVDAQQARRVLDRLVGYSISPILWSKIRRGLSAGRVQSVATRMICDKEADIEAFVPEEYWSIKGLLQNADGKFEVQFYGKEGEKLPLHTEADVKEVMAGLSDTYVVEEVSTRAKKRSSYPPFITSSLQQEASTRFNFSTKKTMIIAQQLYEGVAIKGGTVGLITYMRTDSTRVAPEASKDLLAFIDQTYGQAYVGQLKPGKAKEGAQDAHEAIRPSDVLHTPDSVQSYLTKDQLKLYQLIWERYVASHMSDASFDQTQITIQNQGYTFKASGSIMQFDGFLKVYSFTQVKENLLPPVAIGHTLTCKKMLPEQHFTQPPARYTEASLVKAMEELGIGRPSTYAPTISTILSRGYVEKEKKALKPTELGTLINDIMKTYFNDIVNVSFTANMEQRLDDVEMNDIPWKEIIRDFYQPFKSDLEVAEKEMERIDLVEETDEICEVCQSNMVIKHGRFGKFLACSKYPECNHTRPILKRTGVKCPVCHTGDVIERKTKKFKTFFGCSSFPDCRFMSWHKPTGEPCPTCSEPLIEYQTKKKHVIMCMSKTCRYEHPVTQADDEE